MFTSSVVAVTTTNVIIVTVARFNAAHTASLAIQDIRGWWIWAFYLNPMTWTTWGLVASQVGDEQNVISNPDGTTTTIADYVGTELGLPHYYIGWCVLITACWCLLFRVITALALRYLNFQTR